MVGNGKISGEQFDRGSRQSFRDADLQGDKNVPPAKGVNFLLAAPLEASRDVSILEEIVPKHISRLFTLVLRVPIFPGDLGQLEDIMVGGYL